jgi:hypothetical protein
MQLPRLLLPPQLRPVQAFSPETTTMKDDDFRRIEQKLDLVAAKLDLLLDELRDDDESESPPPTDLDGCAIPVGRRAPAPTDTL